MRHRKAGRRLGRNSSHRKAMLRNLATSLIMHGKIQTTTTRAKELRGWVERLITIGKKSLRANYPADMPEETYNQRKLHLLRLLLRVVLSKKAAFEIFNYADRFSNRPGGYTRIIKLGRRHGDNAPLSLIELLPAEEHTPTPSSEEQ
jgi:large subunit ribosomal protein L17